MFEPDLPITFSHPFWALISFAYHPRKDVNLSSYSNRLLHQQGLLDHQGLTVLGWEKFNQIRKTDLVFELDAYLSQDPPFYDSQETNRQAVDTYWNTWEQVIKIGNEFCRSWLSQSWPIDNSTTYDEPRFAFWVVLGYIDANFDISLTEKGQKFLVWWLNYYWDKIAEDIYKNHHVRSNLYHERLLFLFLKNITKDRWTILLGKSGDPHFWVNKYRIFCSGASND